MVTSGEELEEGLVYDSLTGAADHSADQITWWWHEETHLSDNQAPAATAFLCSPASTATIISNHSSIDRTL